MRSLRHHFTFEPFWIREVEIKIFDLEIHSLARKVIWAQTADIIESQGKLLILRRLRQEVHEKSIP
jgi:hypothetical protein